MNCLQNWIPLSVLFLRDYYLSQMSYCFSLPDSNGKKGGMDEKGPTTGLRVFTEFAVLSASTGDSSLTSKTIWWPINARTKRGHRTTKVSLSQRLVAGNQAYRLHRNSRNKFIDLQSFFGVLQRTSVTVSTCSLSIIIYILKCMHLVEQGSPQPHPVYR